MLRNDLIDRLKLPNYFRKYIPLYFKPLVEIIHDQSQQYTIPIIAINGSQGSGKSTAAVIIKHMLEQNYSHNVVIISIDDFYYTKAERSELAKSIHPLFKTRGVPGTHDIDLAIETILQLKNMSDAETVLIPRFNKAVDDRKPKNQWEKITTPISIIIFEGWCVGSQAVDESQLNNPINKLEEIEDKQGIWRKTSNNHLANDYQRLFKLINYLIMLNVPSFDVVYEWRLLQEKKLFYSLKDLAESVQTELLNKSQLAYFIQHYQRITEQNLIAIPNLANAIIHLNKQHYMTRLEIKS